MTVIGSYQVWPEGLTWCFVGTVQEDGTGGTHISSLTVTPGVGNEMQVLYGTGIVGNTATSQAFLVQIDDGTASHILQTLYRSGGVTTANLELDFPQVQTSLAGQMGLPAAPAIVSGTMRIILSITTAAISVTQQFGLVCRIKGSAPTAVLADSVGTPTLTTLTSKVFG